MFGYALSEVVAIVSFPACILLCLVGLRRFNLLIRATISVGLLGLVFAFRALVSGQAEALGTCLVAAAAGLGLAAVAAGPDVAGRREGPPEQL